MTTSSANARLVEQMRSQTSQRLLAMRAEGDMLDDEWHKAIETVLQERGEPIPPLPSEAIQMTPPRRQSSRWENFGLIILAIFISEFCRQLIHTPLGYVIGLGLILWKLTRWGWMTDAKLQEESEKKAADTDELSELMRCSAVGNVDRVRELLAYDPASLNAQSRVGSTALMYAARNNHLDVIDLLLEAGADTNIRTAKSSTALTIAERHGHDEVAQRLRHGAAAVPI